MVEYYEARVLFDYTPETCDELRLREGEPVEVRIELDHPGGAEEGWLSGTDLRGQHGIFPSNYVVAVRTAAVDAQQSAGHDSNTACVDNTASLDEQYWEQEAIVGGGGIRQQRYVGETGMLETLPAICRTPTGPAAADATVGVEDGPATLAVHSSRGPNNRSDNPLDLQEGGSFQAVHRASDRVLAATAPPAGSRKIGSGDGLPEGWFSAIDEDTGVVYYYTEDRQTSWTKPAAILKTTAALGSERGDPVQVAVDEGDRAEDGNANAESRVRAVARVTYILI